MFSSEQILQAKRDRVQENESQTDKYILAMRTYLNIFGAVKSSLTKTDALRYILVESIIM
ncbi:hypothetical protein DEHALATV1_0994 [Dehalococcoides mccartyi]|uniref:Uncharacterized protein n=1 Tax=Dehalococcoides mccartyi TaxID=61435 RepID=A0AB33HSM6_9CHLR|nr:hypothetical protein DEHALATV1_0994 [Dehalococcoides mccartyi]